MARIGSTVKEDKVQAVRFTLYHAPAVRSARVKWLLHELVGDDFDLEYVDIYGAEQYRTEYLAINPNHSVPTLKITWASGESMYMVESAAMIALLADTFPEKGLAPAPDKLSLARADYLQILHFGASIDWMLWQIRLHEHILPDSEKDIRTVRRYRRKFSLEVEPQLRSRLEKTPYICGDKFCAADCVIAHAVMWAQRYNLCPDETFRRYRATVSKRSAFVSAFSDAHRFVPEVPRENPVVHMVTG
jgi:glutathione S-transferase